MLPAPIRFGGGPEARRIPELRERPRDVLAALEAASSFRKIPLCGGHRSVSSRIYLPFLSPPIVTHTTCCLMLVPSPPGRHFSLSVIPDMGSDSLLLGSSRASPASGIRERKEEKEKLLRIGKQKSRGEVGTRH